MSNVRPIRKPHRLQLNHCSDCDLEIRIQWETVLESEYVDGQVAIDEHEPRVDTRWDRDDTEDDRGLW